MKLPNWAKIVWWLLLVGFFAYLFSQRYNSIMNGVTTSTDIVIFLIFIVLLVIPLFQEFSVFGVSFKRELDNVRNDIEKQIISLKSEIRNTVNIYPYGIPPSDKELPALKLMVDEAVSKAVRVKGIETPMKFEEELKVADDTQFLFQVRYQIETELKRIWRDFDQENIRPRTTALSILSFLREHNFIDLGLNHSIREVYTICSAAIHGEDISNAKVNFVRDVAPELIAYLKSMKTGKQ